MERKASDTEEINYLGLALTKKELRAQRNITFEDVAPKQQAFIRNVLRESFTPNELEMMGKGGLIVRVFPLEEGVYGEYRRKQKGIPVPLIIFDPDLNEDTITHEFVHHARTVDATRTGFVKSAHRIKNGDHDDAYYYCNKQDITNIEEAATVAETTTRTVRPADKLSGYYFSVPETSAKKAYESDRKRLTGNEQSVDVSQTEGIKGKAAINMVNKEFPRTHIAAMKLSERTALQSYDILNNKS